jgi:WD40 repeat protein
VFKDEPRGGYFHTSVSCHTIVFAADNKTLLVGTDRDLRVWDVTTGKLLRDFSQRVEEDRFELAQVAVVSPDGRLLATGGDGPRPVHLWDIATGKLLRELPLDGKRDGTYCIAFSRDGKNLARGHGDFDGKVTVWDVATGKLIRKLPDYNLRVASVALSPDAKTLAVAVSGRWSQLGDYRIDLWDLEAKDAKPRSVPAPGVKWVQFSPDGTTLAWGSGGQAVGLLDAATLRDRHDWEAHHGEVRAVAWTPDGNILATASDDHTIRLWEVATGRAVRTFRGHTGPVNSLAFSPDGRTLLSGGADAEVLLWEVATGKVQFNRDFGTTICTVAFSPDGKSFAAGGWRRQILFWETATGKQGPVFEQKNDITRGLAFSQNNRLLVTGGEHTVTVWDLATGKPFRTWQTPGGDITSVAISPDGHTVAAAHDRGIVLWELLTGWERASFPVWHFKRRGSLAFSPDGRLLASGTNEPSSNMDETIRVWDLATGAALGPFRGHRYHVNGVAFSPDGRRLATASGDTTVLLWDLGK